MVQYMPNVCNYLTEDDEDYEDYMIGFPGAGSVYDSILYVFKRLPARIDTLYQYTDKDGLIDRFEGIIALRPEDGSRKICRYSSKDIPLDCFFKSNYRQKPYRTFLRCDSGTNLFLSGSIRKRYYKGNDDSEFNHLDVSLHIEDISIDQTAGKIHPSAATIQTSNLAEMFENA